MHLLKNDSHIELQNKETVQREFLESGDKEGLCTCIRVQYTHTHAETHTDKGGNANKHLLKENMGEMNVHPHWKLKQDKPILKCFCQTKCRENVLRKSPIPTHLMCKHCSCKVVKENLADSCQDSQQAPRPESRQVPGIKSFITGTVCLEPRVNSGKHFWPWKPHEARVLRQCSRLAYQGSGKPCHG